MNHIKVLHLNKAYAPELGGIETIVQQLAEGLAQRSGFGSEVLTCNTRRKTEYNRRKQVSVTYCASFGSVLSLPISPAYPFLLNSRQADILQLHEPFPLADLSYLLLLKKQRRRFKKLIVWWHSDIIRQKWLYLAYAPLVKMILELADRIIVATPNHITSSHFLPFYKEKCQVVHFGVDVARFGASEERASRALALRRQYGTPLILFVGRLVYYKGLEHLIEAIGVLPAARLVIVGSGPLKARLVELAGQRAPNRVSFLAPQDEDCLMALYRACDIFVLPSTELSEQFGIVLLEAMGCGKPVITFDLPTGVTYVNQRDATGLVVPLRDTMALVGAMNALISNPELRHRLGGYARKRVLADFTLSGMIDQVADIYGTSLA